MSNENRPVHNLAAATVQSMQKWSRKPADFYATPYDGTHGLVPLLKLKPRAVIGEPACGDGAISRVLEAYGFDVISADIRDTGFGLGGYDYLGDQGSPDEHANGSLGWLAEYGLLDAIVTNPPFSHAAKFIRRAVAQAPVVALLLKSNFWNARKNLKLWDECTPTGHFPLTWRLAFLEEERGKSPLMDCDWWIWRQGDAPLPCRPMPRPDPALLPEVAPAPILTKIRANAEARERLNALF